MPVNRGSRLRALSWGHLPTLALVLVCASALPAAAQPKKKGPAPAPEAKAEPAAPAPADKSADKPDKPGEKKKEGKNKNFDFTGIDLNGRMRTPQLLYFLERANEELERASLEKRSFVPHMVRSVDEEQL
jgi:hypothetical protein